MAILISGKVDFREKKMTTGREEHYIMIKGSIHQDIQCMCNATESCKNMKQKHDRIERRNRQSHYYKWKPQHPFSTIGQTKKSISIEKKAIPPSTIGPYRYLWNTPPQNSRIHILFKCTWSL